MSFFISYAGIDRPWAEWLRFHLQRMAFGVELDVWDWMEQDQQVGTLREALARADRLIALWSPAYFEKSRFPVAEWVEVLQDAGLTRRILIFRVAEVTPPRELRPLRYRDLFGLGDESRAREVLYNSLGADGDKDDSISPQLPEEIPGTPRQPGSLPENWNVPFLRNASFTGREALLSRVRHKLTSSGQTAVHSLHGIGGVGKTSLVCEYAYMFAGEYDLVWWINSEQEEMIGEQIANLAIGQGWVTQGLPAKDAVDVAFSRLRSMDRWLLVLDGVSKETDVSAWIPQGRGHVLVTSRAPVFHEVAANNLIGVFTPQESKDYLLRHLPTLTADEAARVASRLGFLPLALSQAVGLIATTQLTPDEYLEELSAHVEQVLGVGTAPDQLPLAAQVNFSMERLVTRFPQAAQLVSICAHLSSEPVPIAWFVTASGNQVLDSPLAEAASSMASLKWTLSAIDDLGFATRDYRTIRMHQLTQDIVRDHSSADDPSFPPGRVAAEKLLISAEPPDDGYDPTTWSFWAELMPHLIALMSRGDPASREIRELGCDALIYLYRRGEHRLAEQLARQWREDWKTIDGKDDRSVLRATGVLASVTRELGDHEKARRLAEETLARFDRVWGETDRDTLRVANTLANILREMKFLREARALAEDTLRKYHEVLGEEHPDTLRAANNFANILRDLREYSIAQEVIEGTYSRRRSVLGEFHPDTLASANELAATYRELGKNVEALRLMSSSYGSRKGVLGESHPDTLRSLHELAMTYFRMNDYRQSLTAFEECVKFRRQILTENHRDTLMSEHWLALCHYQIRDFAEARSIDEGVLHRRHKSLGKSHSDTLESVNSLVADLLALGLPELADPIKKYYLGE